jgi:hypothetical protein
LPTFERGEATSGSASAGGPTLATSSGSVGGQGGQSGEECVRAHVPEAPSSDDGGVEQDLTAALRSLSVRDATQKISGFDLDGLCTCSGDSWSCLPETLTRQSNAYCDAAGGRDNSLGQLLLDAGDTVGVTSWKPIWSEAANDGRWGLLFQLEDYNGSLNDSQVKLTVLTSDGLSPAAPKPAWLGDDIWPPSEDSFALDSKGMPDPSAPLAHDPKAYVSNGILVAQLPKLLLRIDSIPFAIALELDAVTLSATLEGSGNQFAMRKGTLAARMSTHQLLNALNSIRFNSLLICQTDELYPTSRSAWCSARDLPANAQVEPSIPCANISAALAFEAEAAQRGEPKASKSFVRDCLPEAQIGDTPCID